MFSCHISERLNSVSWFEQYLSWPCNLKKKIHKLYYIEALGIFVKHETFRWSRVFSDFSELMDSGHGQALFSVAPEAFRSFPRDLRRK